MKPQRETRPIAVTGSRGRAALLSGEASRPPRVTARSPTIIGSLAEHIERDTGESWRTDAFTGTALVDCIEAILVYLTPETAKNPALPPLVAKQAAKMPPEFAEQYRTPAGFGFMRAHSLIAEIENRPRPGNITTK